MIEIETIAGPASFFLVHHKRGRTKQEGLGSAIQDMLQNHNRDVKGLYLSGEYLFLVACTEGALATGKEAAEQLVADRMQLAVR